jgi:hypothetical protein
MMVCVNEEEALVRARRSCLGDRTSGQGGAPWRRGTSGGVGGIRKQPKEATTGGVLMEEDDDGGNPVAHLR